MFNSSKAFKTILQASKERSDGFSKTSLGQSSGNGRDLFFFSVADIFSADGAV
jgi:hypothetical protein